MKYLGFVLLVLSGYVMAEEVYYCSDNDNGANGFKKIDGQYKSGLFEEKKFKMKLQDDGNIAISERGDTRLYFCFTIYPSLPRHSVGNGKSCVNEFYNGEYFNFNQDNGRYIKISAVGYVYGGDDNSDSVTTRIGTCTKF
jgi:hypothetical protein